MNGKLQCCTHAYVEKPRRVPRLFIETMCSEKCLMKIRADYYYGNLYVISAAQ